MVIRELARIAAWVALILLFAASVLALLILAAWVLELVVTFIRTHPISDRVGGAVIATGIILVILYGQWKHERQA